MWAELPAVGLLIALFVRAAHSPMIAVLCAPCLVVEHRVCWDQRPCGEEPILHIACDRQREPLVRLKVCVLQAHTYDHKHCLVHRLTYCTGLQRFVVARTACLYPIACLTVGPTGTDTMLLFEAQGPGCWPVFAQCCAVAETQGTRRSECCWDLGLLTLRHDRCLSRVLADATSAASGFCEGTVRLGFSGRMCTARTRQAPQTPHRHTWHTLHAPWISCHATCLERAFLHARQASRLKGERPDEALPYGLRLLTLCGVWDVEGLHQLHALVLLADGLLIDGIPCDLVELR